MATKKWIQKAHLKKGALHRQLGIINYHTISNKLLKDIVKANVNSYIIPSDYQTADYGEVKVTPLLKRRAQLVLNLKNLKR